MSFSAERTKQYFRQFYLLLFLCFNCAKTLGIIHWNLARRLMGFLVSAVEKCVSIGAAGLILAVLIVFILEKAREYRTGSSIKDFLKSCFFHPVIFNLVLLLAGNFLIRTFGRIDMTPFLMLIYLAGCAGGREKAFVLFVSASSGAVLAVSTCLLGLTKDVTVSFHYGLSHSLGFGNPNHLGLYCFLIVLTGWYLWEGKKRLPVTAAGTAAAALCYMISRCRTASIMIMLVLLSDYLIPRSFFPGNRTLRKIRQTFITFLPLIMTVFSVIAGIVLLPYDSDKEGHSNFIIRFVDCIYAYRFKGLSLYPQDFIDPERPYYFDNGYFAWIFKEGLIASAGLLLPILGINNTVAKNNRRKPVIMLCCAALYLCMENAPVLLFLPAIAAGGFLLAGNDHEDLLK